MLGLDQVVEWARAWQDSCKEEGVVRVFDDRGKWWTSNLNKEWSNRSFSSVVGRVADLKSAYKQLPLHPAHQ
eukprot:459644-Karenia_brevis.AAC.1